MLAEEASVTISSLEQRGDSLAKPLLPMNGQMVAGEFRNHSVEFYGNGPGDVMELERGPVESMPLETWVEVERRLAFAEEQVSLLAKASRIADSA